MDSRRAPATQRSWPRLAMLVVVAVVTVSCGTDSSGVEGSGSEPGGSVVRTDRDAVIDAWGSAAVRGDASALIDLLEPRIRETISNEQLAWIESLELPSEVTVTGFGFDIVSVDASSVEVRYRGERCAPTISKSFGPTSLVGDAATGATSMSSDGTIIEGDLVCVDLEDDPGPLSPHRFVQVDGAWYGTFPGF